MIYQLYINVKFFNYSFSCTCLLYNYHAILVELITLLEGSLTHAFVRECLFAQLYLIFYLVKLIYCAISIVKSTVKEISVR